MGHAYVQYTGERRAEPAGGVGGALRRGRGSSIGCASSSRVGLDDSGELSRVGLDFGVRVLLLTGVG